MAASAEADQEESFTANWSHDGRWLYFASKRSARLSNLENAAQGVTPSN